MVRSKKLFAVVVTLLLLALMAGMALAAGGPSPTLPITPAGHGYGYGYGYDGGPADECSYAVCRGVAAGRVTDAASGAALAGVSVTLQERAAGGAWVTAADVRPTANPQATDAAGRFTWLARGGKTDDVRVLATRDGYAPGTSAVRARRADGALDIALTPLPAAPVAGAGGSGSTPATPAAPAGGAGAPAAPKPVVTPVARPKGCAAKKGKAKTACLRAQRLATALKACKAQKGSRRRTCEKRARALSACEAKTAKKRPACRAKARAIGRPAKKPAHR
jgi:hypothetical protein